MPTISLKNADAVAETLLYALYGRAREARQTHPILRDVWAVALVDQIEWDFSRYKYSSVDQATLCMRLREFDRHAAAFLARNPDAVVVHIGCGLDTRFQRVDNGRVEWYDLDLPEVIALRRRLIGETERCHALAHSVFDPAWLEIVSAHADRAILFLAEGVLPYFDEAQVKSLFQRLTERFPSAELVCDGMTPLMVRLNNLQLAFSKIGAQLRWGMRHGRVPEAWAPGIRLLDEWFYFDRPEPRLGATRLMRYVPALARGVGIFHYRLGGPQESAISRNTGIMP